MAMPEEGKCRVCGKEGKIYWAVYCPYCKECLAKKSKYAMSFEEAMRE